MAKKIYAVRKGHKTGIFDTWDECKAAIDGFSGAEFKSFGNINDAEAYLKNEDVAQKNTGAIINAAVSGGTVIAYIDGSYDDKTKKYAFGCVIVTPSEEVFKESGCGEELEAIAIHNVAGELQGALYVTKWAIKNSYQSLEIRHDYEGVAKWITGEWKPKNKIVKLYVDEMGELTKLLTIKFTKVAAHTNDPLNEEADQLAKEALTTGKKTKTQKGETWFTAEGIPTQELKTILDLVLEEIENVKIDESEIPYGKQYELTAPPKEKIVLCHYSEKNRVRIQGKPQRLFSALVTYITELVDVEKIPELFNGFFKVDINKENVQTEFETFLPNANGKLPDKINKVLHQAVYNLNITGDFFDATFLAEPALRALEGHLKQILITNCISLKEQPTDKYDKFYMFDKIGNNYQFKNGIGDKLDTGLKVYIYKCYSFFTSNRHRLCHWDDPTLAVDTTALINSPNDAHELIRKTLSLVDEYYKMLK
jgi:viroplasmin and RNaseH domain-containing protein